MTRQAVVASTSRQRNLHIPALLYCCGPCLLVAQSLHDREDGPDDPLRGHDEYRLSVRRAQVVEKSGDARFEVLDRLAAVEPRRPGVARGFTGGHVLLEVPTLKAAPNVVEARVN